MKWISVGDRLPEKRLDVLIYPPKEHWNSHFIHLAQLRAEGDYDNWRYVQDNSSYIVRGVTHWMEIEPPNELNKG